MKVKVPPPKRPGFVFVEQLPDLPVVQISRNYGMFGAIDFHDKVRALLKEYPKVIVTLVEDFTIDAVVVRRKQ